MFSTSDNKYQYPDASIRNQFVLDRYKYRSYQLLVIRNPSIKPLSALHRERRTSSNILRKPRLGLCRFRSVTLLAMDRMSITRLDGRSKFGIGLFNHGEIFFLSMDEDRIGSKENVH